MKTLALILTWGLLCGCTGAMRMENAQLRREKSDLLSRAERAERANKILKIEADDLRETVKLLSRNAGTDRPRSESPAREPHSIRITGGGKEASWRGGDDNGRVIGALKQDDLGPITEARAKKELALLNSAIAGMKEFQQQVGNDCWQYAEYHEALLRAVDSVKSRQPKYGEIITPNLAELPEAPTREAQEQLAQRREKQQALELDRRFKERQLAQAAQQHAERITAIDAQIRSQKLNHEELMAMEQEKKGLLEKQVVVMEEQKAEMKRQSEQLAEMQKTQKEARSAQAAANADRYDATQRIANDLYDLKWKMGY